MSSVITYTFIDNEEYEDAKARIRKEVGEPNGFDWSCKLNYILIGDDRVYTNRICRICELYKVALDGRDYQTQRIECIGEYLFMSFIDYQKAVDSFCKEIDSSDSWGKEKCENYAFIWFYDNISNSALAERICKANNGLESSRPSSHHTLPKSDW